MVSRFRVKKLSPKHPLPVYKESQLPDITDASNVQRAVPQIETGVEKEEEEEHDLQAAISAHHAAVTTGAKVESYIPTPDASSTIPEKNYHHLYNRHFKEPSTLIRFSSTVEDVIGCPYVMDEEDDAFLKEHNKANSTDPISEDNFEQMMWLYETTANQHWPHLDLDSSQIPSYAAFQGVISDKSALIESVFTHWQARRREHEGRPIISPLRYEDTQKGEIDPYVCFRRRETKPVRKTRRTDQQSLERLRKLRSEMEMARNLLEMVLRREKIRKEGLVLEHTVFDKKCKLREYQRQLGIKEDEDLMPKKKRKTSLESGSSGATIKIPLNKLKRGDDLRHEKSPIQQAIEAELARKREQDAGYEDVTYVSNHDHFFAHISHSRCHYHSNSFNHYHHKKAVCVSGSVLVVVVVCLSIVLVIVSNHWKVVVKGANNNLLQHFNKAHMKDINLTMIPVMMKKPWKWMIWTKRIFNNECSYSLIVNSEVLLPSLLLLQALPMPMLYKLESMEPAQLMPHLPIHK